MDGIRIRLRSTNTKLKLRPAYSLTIYIYIITYMNVKGGSGFRLVLIIKLFITSSYTESAS